MYNVGLDKFGKKEKQQPEEVAKITLKKKTKCDYHWGMDCYMWQKFWENQIKGLTFSWVKEEYQRKAKDYNMDKKKDGKEASKSKIYSQRIPIYIKILGSELSETFRPWTRENIGCNRELTVRDIFGV